MAQERDYKGHTVHNVRVPKSKMGLFHAILCDTQGRYLRNPILVGENYIVDYAPGDDRLQQIRWQQCMTPIRESFRNQWWRVMYRRLVNLKVRF